MWGISVIFWREIRKKMSGVPRIISNQKVSSSSRFSKSEFNFALEEQQRSSTQYNDGRREWERERKRKRKRVTFENKSARELDKAGIKIEKKADWAKRRFLRSEKNTEKMCVWRKRWRRENSPFHRHGHTSIHTHMLHRSDTRLPIARDRARDRTEERLAEKHRKVLSSQTWAHADMANSGECARKRQMD